MADLHHTYLHGLSRDIDAAGGLDRYLVQMPNHKIESDKGWQLKSQILASYRKLESSETP